MDEKCEIFLHNRKNIEWSTENRDEKAKYERIQVKICNIERSVAGMQSNADKVVHHTNTMRPLGECVNQTKWMESLASNWETI